MVLLFASTSGSKNSGSAFLGSAISFKVNRKITISMSTNTAMTLQITKDGTNYYNGATFAANDAKDLTLWVQAGDSVNFKQSSGNTVTLGWFEIFSEDGQ